MSSLIRQLRELPHRDKLRFSGIIFSVLTLKVILRLFGFQRTVKFLRASIQKNSQKNRNSLGKYRSLLKLCNLFFSHFGFCLPISLTFWWILKRQGIKTSLYFGMRKEGEKLLSHAWLEYCGVPLAGKVNNKKNYKSIEIFIA